MDTASLKIKFTPLIKNFQRGDSNCCLEIIPEVSCLQNFDKIEWKQEDFCIQYTIPITYKVIMTKSDVAKSDSDAVKTYHSCVDLFSSSLINLEMASGDVSRITSDNFIFGKLTSQMDNYCNASFENMIKKQNKSCPRKKTNYSKGTEVFYSTSSLLKAQQSTAQVILRELDYEEVTTKNKEVTCILQFQTTGMETEYDEEYDGDDLPRTVQFVQTISSMEAILHKDETKKRLSLSPVCSIDTCDNKMFVEKTVRSNSLSYRLYTPNTQLLYFPKVTFPDEQVKSMEKSIENVHCKWLTPYPSKPSNRVLPEVRVAKFVKHMEAEIGPLKTMLNDIVSKFTALDIVKKEHGNKIIVKRSNRECQTRCNRVVYSVVFDS